MSLLILTARMKLTRHPILKHTPALCLLIYFFNSTPPKTSHMKIDIFHRFSVGVVCVDSFQGNLSLSRHITKLKMKCFWRQKETPHQSTGRFLNYACASFLINLINVTFLLSMLALGKIYFIWKVWGKFKKKRQCAK